MNVVTAETVDHARTTKHARMQTREERIADAIDDFQTAVLDLHRSLAPTNAQSVAVGRARKNLLAAIAAKDRSERLAA